MTQLPPPQPVAAPIRVRGPVNMFVPWFCAWWLLMVYWAFHVWQVYQQLQVELADNPYRELGNSWFRTAVLQAAPLVMLEAAFGAGVVTAIALAVVVLFMHRSAVFSPRAAWRSLGFSKRP